MPDIAPRERSPAHGSDRIASSGEDPAPTNTPRT